MLKEFIVKQRAKGELLSAFSNMGLYKTYKKGNGRELKAYPKIHAVIFKEKTIEYTFTLLNGMDPKELKKKEYVLSQHFGKHFKIEGENKKFVLIIYKTRMKKELTYSYEDIKESIKDMKVPIICGMNLNGEWVAYDAKTEPNALISGEPGSGKSTQLRSILCTLIQTKSPQELHLYLGDLKMSEFHLFRGVDHVKEVSVFPEELEKMLGKVYTEMVKRSKLLNKAGVMHVDDLPKNKRVPYIVLAIDEIVMVMDNKDIKKMLVQIGSLGRALGIYNILSLQRPSHDILDTKVRSLLTVRMGFRTTDLSNAKIIGTPGSDKISKDTPGRFLLKRDTLTEIQAPYLDENKAKKLLEGYKSKKQENSVETEINENEKETKDDVGLNDTTELTEKDVFFDAIDEA